jgi:hypothetical protein
MDAIQKNLLEQVADLHTVPEGAYNIRVNGKAEGRSSSANIDIVPKPDKDGIDIIIKPGTKNESVHIPVVLSQSRRRFTAPPHMGYPLRLVQAERNLLQACKGKIFQGFPL